jgi:hypothetical protein
LPETIAYRNLRDTSTENGTRSSAESSNPWLFFAASTPEI